MPWPMTEADRSVGQCRNEGNELRLAADCGHHVRIVPMMLGVL